ncbi:sigma-54-dependent Fis family transcriptional regulator [Chitinibacter bivalviorum]|uniref:Sigma-54-dependent Fis family transcriptional regulator n=1 Tax=Chitinibacter bivalviorum TaxID=2739434 RepID=A0A7H9BIH5_9NEIS|nr:sigma-54 dependent transcriptional regulator [Chitinibacter bivalviorum]QLG88086.1 sigma-54-dependent Fis family transcriptional regulator [Chitinibacter bivalviorum]
MALPVLIVEDDDDLREALIDTLELDGYAVVVAEDGSSALKVLASQQVGLVISDVQMQPMDGEELLREVKKLYPCLPMILMTAYGMIEQAVNALHAGASHYLPKPFEPAALLEQVERYLLPDLGEDELVAESEEMQQLLDVARRAAMSDASIMLTGESGVGKEVMARFIHRHSSRAGKPFVAINCAAIPEQLLESTLFGHEKGAFTGAAGHHVGKFEQAQGGTILLDEVTEMPLPLQAKLLRVLQERELERVGGVKSIHLDIRVLATSNRDLAEEVAAGHFREDLYYRLNVFPLQIPALRQRKKDILPLARNMLARYASVQKKRSPVLQIAAQEVLLIHQWPGNIRELDNVMQRALILAPGDEIAVEHLFLPVLAAKFAVSNDVIEPVASGSIKDMEKTMILDVLKAAGGVRKVAAEKLGMSERTLRYKLAQYREEDGGLPI